MGIDTFPSSILKHKLYPAHEIRPTQRHTQALAELHTFWAASEQRSTTYLRFNYDQISAALTYTILPTASKDPPVLSVSKNYTNERG